METGETATVVWRHPWSMTTGGTGRPGEGGKAASSQQCCCWQYYQRCSSTCAQLLGHNIIYDTALSYVTLYEVFNRPGLAGAVLQTPLSLILQVLNFFKGIHPYINLAQCYKLHYISELYHLPFVNNNHTCEASLQFTISVTLYLLTATCCSVQS